MSSVKRKAGPVYDGMTNVQRWPRSPLGVLLAWRRSRPGGKGDYLLTLFVTFFGAVQYFSRLILVRVMILRSTVARIGCLLGLFPRHPEDIKAVQCLLV